MRPGSVRLFHWFNPVALFLYYPILLDMGLRPQTMNLETRRLNSRGGGRLRKFLVCPSLAYSVVFY